MTENYKGGYNKTQKMGNQRSYETDEDKFDKNCKDSFEENYSRFFLQSEDYDSFISKLKKFMEKISKDIPTSQLRNVFALIKKENEPIALKRIRPKIAYTYGRAEKNDSLKLLLFFMDSQLQGLKVQSEIEKLKDLFEAIVAYHKYYGGKD